MKLTIVLLVVLVLLALRVLKVRMLTWVAGWWFGMWLLVHHGFTIPVPMSVQKIYLGIITLSLMAYVLSDEERIEDVRRPLAAFLTERKHAPLLAATVLAIPALVAFSIYAQMTSPVQPPSFGRTVHPAPPDAITVHDENFAIATMDNPYRQLEENDPEEFARRVANGREVYYSNCLWCHGDLMAGDGMFAHGLNPIPTSFEDPNTIAMLRESFLFWRISKGAPGLPEEAGPWASAMPAWENFLDQDEMWNVILFLYEFTEYRPRAVELH